MNSQSALKRKVGQVAWTIFPASVSNIGGSDDSSGNLATEIRQRVGQHLEIGLRALEKLKAQDWERLHLRKLRSFAEVAFQ